MSVCTLADYRLDMRPGLAGDDGADARLRDSVFGHQVSLEFSRRHASPDGQDLIGSQLRGRAEIAVSICRTTSGVTVRRVVLESAKHQMFQSNTWRIVAGVTHDQSCRDGAVFVGVDPAVSAPIDADVLPVSVAFVLASEELAIPVGHTARRPDMAVAGSVNVGFKSLSGVSPHTLNGTGESR